MFLEFLRMDRSTLLATTLFVISEQQRRDSVVLLLSGTIIAIILATLAAVEVESQDERPPPVKRRKISHPRHFWNITLPLYDKLRFQRFMRMDRSMFNFIVEDLKKHPSFAVAQNVLSLAIPVGLQLTIAIHRIAHHKSMRDIAEKFDVGEATVNKATWLVLQALVELYKKKYIDDKFPLTRRARMEAARAFQRKTRCGIPGVIGLIDGVHIPVDSVPVGHHMSHWWNFKHFYSLTFLHVVNVRKQHIFIGGGIPGRAHDSSLLANSWLRRQAGRIFQNDTHLLGDSGFAAATWLITRGRGSNLTAAERSMDQKISSMRAGVEMAFGITKARFRFARGTNGVSFQEGKDAFGKVLTADRKYQLAWLSACILHNMCIDWKADTAAFDAMLEEDAEEQREGGFLQYRFREELPAQVANPNAGETPKQKKMRLYQESLVLP